MILQPLLTKSHNFCHNLFCRVNGVQKPVSRYEVKFKQKCEKLFSQNFSSYSKLSGFFTTSFLFCHEHIIIRVHYFFSNRQVYVVLFV
ncbi:hypothetical protein B1P87_05950 [Enterococcus faecium]|nr:hypothetical protein B1P87_05950 [Enterococcus faecium]